MAEHTFSGKMNTKIVFKNLFLITLGALLMAFTIDTILLPYDIIDGGITGISMMISSLTGIKLGILLFALNLPFIIWGYKKLGKYFTIFTIYAITVLSVFTNVIHETGFIVEGLDTFLAAVVGGVGLGIAIGIILRVGSAADSVDLIAVILSKKTGMSVGNIIMIINIFIFSASIYTHDVSTAFYSMITYFIAKNVIDMVVDGVPDSKTLMISSDKIEEIGEAIINELELNFTFFKAIGGYEKKDRLLIYVAVNRVEEVKLKRIIENIDKKAFYVVGVAQEHRGRIVKR